MMSLPTIHSDGSFTGVVSHTIADAFSNRTLTLTLPTGVAPETLAGRFILARCSDTPANPSGIYLRRPLFLVSARTVADGALANCEFLLPDNSDPGGAWLQGLPDGAGVHLLGPFGVGFVLPPHSRALLLIADQAHVLPLLPLMDQMLDRGGRVTLLLRETPSLPEMEIQTLRTALAARLPLPVEVQPVGSSEEWHTALHRLLPWADQLCAALPAQMFAELAASVRQRRFRLDEGFAQVLIEADYVCGWGGCLACITSLARGNVTRACIHGPVMDLTRLG